MDRQSLIGLTHFKNKDGIIVVEAPTTQKANESAAEILQKYTDSKTALFLSGGTTPKKFYELITRQKSLKAGAVGMIDERFGEKDHRNSNELMIKNTGLLEYFDEQNIRFYGILKDKEIEETAGDYDETLRFVFKYFPKSVGIMGIGSDGHTAGIPAGIMNHESRIKNSGEIVRKMIEDQSSLVSYYELEGYGKRITMNFQALSMLDLIIILALGQEKRETLAQMFKEGPIEEFPARFYLKPEIAAKTILITDQIV
ncbi:MAG: 6-phosphogluconolactonase [Patescibacteria group bacterium]